MKLYLDGWRKDNDFHSRWVGRHVDVTHVTARLVVGKLSMSLHTDFENVKWLPTGWMIRNMYEGNFYKIQEKEVGEVTNPRPCPLTDMTSARWKQTMVWFYGGRLLAPSWRPHGCVRNVRIAAEHYGYTLPDTAYTDDLFNGDIQCK